MTWSRKRWQVSWNLTVRKTYIAVLFAFELNNRPGEYSFSQKHCMYEKEETKLQTASHSTWDTGGDMLLTQDHSDHACPDCLQHQLTGGHFPVIQITVLQVDKGTDGTAQQAVTTILPAFHTSKHVWPLVRLWPIKMSLIGWELQRAAWAILETGRVQQDHVISSSINLHSGGSPHDGKDT